MFVVDTCTVALVISTEEMDEGHQSKYIIFDPSKFVQKTYSGGHKQGDSFGFKLCWILSDDDTAILAAQIIVKNAVGQQMILGGANGPACMAPLLVGAAGCASVQVLAPSRFREFRDIYLTKQGYIPVAGKYNGRRREIYL